MFRQIHHTAVALSSGHFMDRAERHVRRREIAADEIGQRIDKVGVEPVHLRNGTPERRFPVRIDVDAELGEEPVEDLCVSELLDAPARHELADHRVASGRRCSHFLVIHICQRFHVTHVYQDRNEPFVDGVPANIIPRDGRDKIVRQCAGLSFVPVQNVLLRFKGHTVKLSAGQYACRYRFYIASLFRL